MAMVYALECTFTGWAYVGVTGGKLGKRFREHRCLCNTRKHHATKLINDWHEFGEGAFVMRALEETEYGHRGVHCPAEQKWIDHYGRQGKLYNAREQSTGCSPEAMMHLIEKSRHAVGNRWTPEANLKRRLAQLGKPKGHGAKISSTKRLRKQVMI